MKTLILMRHAKSSWATPGQLDHERPLNKRGRKSAKALGDWLRDTNRVPDQVLSSDSVRTRETFEWLNLDAPVAFVSALYHADAMAIKAELLKATGDRVLVLGHNPGIAEFAANIVRNPPDHHQFYFYPTCATTVVSLPYAGWSELRWQEGDALDFVIPRELIAAQD